MRSQVRQICAISFLAIGVFQVSAETRGASTTYICPLDGEVVTFRPVKSRLVVPFTSTGKGVMPPVLHECSRCGYIADTAEWNSPPAMTLWRRIHILMWLTQVANELPTVERWAALAGKMSLSAARRGARYLMAANALPQRSRRLLQHAEKAFLDGHDLWSVYFQAELKRKRGDASAWAQFARLQQSAPSHSVVGRWVRERLTDR